MGTCPGGNLGDGNLKNLSLSKTAVVYGKVAMHGLDWEIGSGHRVPEDSCLTCIYDVCVMNSFWEIRVGRAVLRTKINRQMKSQINVVKQ